MALGEITYGYFMPNVNLMGPGSAKNVGQQVKTFNPRKATIDDIIQIYKNAL